MASLRPANSEFQKPTIYDDQAQVPSERGIKSVIPLGTMMSAQEAYRKTLVDPKPFSPKSLERIEVIKGNYKKFQLDHPKIKLPTISSASDLESAKKILKEEFSKSHNTFFKKEIIALLEDLNVVKAMMKEKSSRHDVVDHYAAGSYILEGQEVSVVTKRISTVDFDRKYVMSDIMSRLNDLQKNILYTKLGRDIEKIKALVNDPSSDPKKVKTALMELKVGLKKELQNLYNSVQSPQVIKDVENIQKILGGIEKLEQYGGVSFISSEDFPTRMKVGQANGQSYEQSIEKVPSLLGNLHTQTIATEKDELTVTRHAAIHDPRNGWFSLKELQGAIFVNSSGQESADIVKLKQIRAQIEELKESHPKLYKEGSLNRQSMDYALKLLDSVINAGTPEMSLKVLKNIISERKEFLEKQMLQLVHHQILRNPELIKDGQFNLVYISLMNEFEKSTEKEKMKAGFRWNEKASLEDMQVIFNDFKGKQIQFVKDGEPIGFDQANKDLIYMPCPKGQKVGSQIVLQSYLFNAPVRRDLSPVSQEINKETMKNMQLAMLKDLEARLYSGSIDFQEYNRLVEELGEKFGITPIHGEKDESKHIYRISKPKSHTYTDSVDIFFKFKDMAAVSYGCQQAKDRTQGTTAMIFKRFLTPNFGTKSVNHVTLKMFSKKATSWIIGPNTGKFWLKLMNTDFENMDMDKKLRSQAFGKVIKGAALSNVVGSRYRTSSESERLKKSTSR